VRIILQWLVFTLVAFCANWILASSSLQKATANAGTIYFKGGILIRIIFGIFIPTLFYGAAVVATSPTLRSNWWVALILLACALGAIAYWPEQIVTDSNEIRQSRVLGLGWRVIPWADIECAIVNPATGSVEVIPKAGRKVVHTAMHVDRNEFLAVLRSHHTLL
jgi:hypothetical protein